MTAVGELIEIQGTGEKAPFPRAQLDELLNLAQSGINEIIGQQQAVLQRA
jgi:ribonuclease PH